MRHPSPTLTYPLPRHPCSASACTRFLELAAICRPCAMTATAEAAAEAEAVVRHIAKSENQIEHKKQQQQQ